MILGSVLAGPSIYSQELPVQNTQQQLDQSLLETFEEKLKIYQSDINQNILTPSKGVAVKQILKDEDRVELTTRQMNAILLYAPEFYKELFSINTCSVYTLLKNRLININNQPLLNVEVNITNTQGTTKALVPIDIFLASYYKNKCRLSFKQSRLFTKGIYKDTFEKLTPKFPRNEEECLDQYAKLRANINLDHICSASYTINLAQKLTSNLSDTKITAQQRGYINSLRRQAKNYEDEISEKDLLYFNNFCANLNREEKFCANYSTQDFWSLIINKQKTTEYIKIRCEKILNKSTLQELDYLRCIKYMRDNPSTCEKIGPELGSVLYPMPKCTEVSDALRISKLKNNFNDCPNKIRNLAITNGARVIKHFSSNDIKSNDCVFPSYEKIYGLYLETKEESKWPLKICYNSNDEKRCLPFIPGNSKENFNALNMVIAEMLFQTKIVSSRIKCEEVSKSKYNPLRLKYKGGCWIVPEEVSCRSKICNYKIMLDGKDIKKIWSEGALAFDYFKTEYNSLDTAIHDRIVNLLNIKDQEINSLTSLRFFLDNKKNGIIHGLGCAEDIYPANFQLNKLGICTPMPFIIDGYKEINNNTYLSFRGAVDDINSPRVILWANVFTAISRYSVLSPLKNWELYGLY